MGVEIKAGAELDRAVAEAAGIFVEELRSPSGKTGYMRTDQRLDPNCVLFSPSTDLNAAFAAAEKTSVQAINSDAIAIVYVQSITKPTFDPKGEAEAAYLAQLANVYANDRVEVLGAVARTANPATINNVPEAPPAGPYLQ